MTIIIHHGMLPDGGNGGGRPGEDDAHMEVAEAGEEAVEVEQRRHLTLTTHFIIFLEDVLYLGFINHNNSFIRMTTLSLRTFISSKHREENQ